ncbi:hypothetical protein [Nevskia sp.]|uniref:hypothetical protein n=1 Tax=Nevskia sp. TaxID=1929292 RepID=UPI0025D1562D|nr:hypothetical protein [Nevskia sp.]
MNETDQDFLADWPVTSDGWQLIDLGKSLFPGGPWAYQVRSPIGRFFCGVSFRKCNAFDDDEIAVVTNLGRSKILPPADNLLLDSTVRRTAEQQIDLLLRRYTACFTEFPLRHVEFAPGDGTLIDVF